MSSSRSTTRYRDTNTGRLLSDRQGERMPPSKVTREHLPKPGNGDTGRYDKPKK